ncbi:MAG: GntR family transcriptional regulator [Gaiellaceae bacterium]
MSSPLARIEHRYLRDEAFSRLREAIVGGTLEPGAPLVIDDAAGMLGLSSMPVREAVRRLVAEGLVEEVHGRRHRVAPLTRESALNVLTVSETLIVRAYELGVPNLTREHVARMRLAFERAVESAEASDLTGAQELIHEFHGVVYEATGNPEFGRLIRAVVSRFDRVLRLWYGESIANVRMSYRADVLSALEQGEREEALRIVRDAWVSFRRVVESRGETPALGE